LAYEGTSERTWAHLGGCVLGACFHTWGYGPRLIGHRYGCCPLTDTTTTRTDWYYDHNTKRPLLTSKC
jgi:hypothetical protein